MSGLERTGRWLGLVRRPGEPDPVFTPRDQRRMAPVLVPALALLLPGLLTLLHDRHFDDRECIAWIFTDDDLPGRPIDALRENRGSEVKRRAQVLGY